MYVVFLGNMGLYVHRNHQGVLGTGKLGGSGFFISNTYSLHRHHQNDCRKEGSCVSHFNVSLNCVGKVTRQCPQTTIFEKRREEKGEPKRIEPRPFCLPAKRLTARPHRLTIVSMFHAQVLYSPTPGIHAPIPECPHFTHTRM